ncbi:hypothetical protein HYQ46_006649 [Verticillium longisporum]|nr:hypothetical protein HYQ46_006649 [Verticillium longisporum]
MLSAFAATTSMLAKSAKVVKTLALFHHFLSQMPLWTLYHVLWRASIAAIELMVYVVRFACCVPGRLDMTKTAPARAARPPTQATIIFRNQRVSCKFCGSI